MADPVPVGPDDGRPVVSVGAGSVPAEAFTDRTGVVTSFDEAGGSGVIADDASGSTWYFHCTRIADGSRTIEVAAPVTFITAPGPTGVEAVDVSPIPDR